MPNTAKCPHFRDCSWIWRVRSIRFENTYAWKQRWFVAARSKCIKIITSYNRWVSVVSSNDMASITTVATTISAVAKFTTKSWRHLTGDCVFEPFVQIDLKHFLSFMYLYILAISYWSSDMVTIIIVSRVAFLVSVFLCIVICFACYLWIPFSIFVDKIYVSSECYQGNICGRLFGLPPYG